MHEATTDARLVGRFFRLQLTLIGGGFAVIATLIAT